MPAQTAKSVLLAKLGNRYKQAWLETRAEKVAYDNFEELPPGIKNGVAKLKSITFGEFKDGDNKGQLFFQAMGVIEQPVEHKGIPLYGRQTRIGPEALCDTPNAQGKRKTLKDHINWVRNQLGRLGLKTAEVEPENLEDACKKLVERDPPVYFRFSTRAGQLLEVKEASPGKWRVYANGKPNMAAFWPTEEAAQKANPYAGRDARVFTEWQSELPGYNPQDPTITMTHDATGGTSGNGEMPHADDEPSEPVMDDEPESGDTGASESASGNGAAAAEAVPSRAEFGDLDSLAEAAHNNDEAARAELFAFAEAAGYTRKEAEEVDAWKDIVDMIRNPRKKPVAATQVASAAKPGGPKETKRVEKTPQPVVIPEAGKMCRYKPKDPSDPKKTLRTVDCEINKVNVEKQTVSLKNVVDGKSVYLGIPWAELLPPSD